MCRVCTSVMGADDLSGIGYGTWSFKMGEGGYGKALEV